MIREWNVFLPRYKARNCIVALAGRGSSVELMKDVCFDMALTETSIVSIRPYNFEWYPQPISSFDQKEAVMGLKAARHSIEASLKQVTQAFGFQRENIVMLGFSAGAVMAIQVAAFSPVPFKAVVVLSGAILEPSKLPACKHPDTPFLLQHNQDDKCFDWDERYLPMKQALTNRGYPVYNIEGERGGHGLSLRNIIAVSQFLAPKLGYGETWLHPKLYNEEGIAS